MILTKMYGKLKALNRFVTSCRIYVGRDPNGVVLPAVIIFPFRPARLSCGFAGLMTCRQDPSAFETLPQPALAALFERIQKAGLQTVLSGGHSVADYLGGMDCLLSVGSIASALKRESAQEILFFSPDRTGELSRIAGEMKSFIVREEKFLEDQAAAVHSADLETVNSRVLLLKDIQWMLERDILANLKKVLALSGENKETHLSAASFRKYRKLNLLLNALDRLEVRGRDSAGLQIAYTLQNEEDLPDTIQQLRDQGLFDDFSKRTRPGDLFNLSICVTRVGGQGPAGVIFTYKTFSIVGELGRNVLALRQTICNDRILQVFAARASVCETALTHTRWASVGSITEENCHPVNNFLTGEPSAENSPQIEVVLNGDIDNYPALRQALEADGERIALPVTTDTKIIPLQIEHYLKRGESLTESFRLAVNDFEGSHAIAMQCDLAPGKMFLALKGSGQSIYVGIGAGQYMFSSELYGLVEVMPQFIKMNGEAVSGAAAGQIFILDQNSGAGVKGITAGFYDGTPLELTEAFLQTAEITTRDIDRGGFSHFFLKEISESALSIRRTLRGKYRITQSGSSAPRVAFNLGADMVPGSVLKGLQSGSLENIIVIGHGTAAVAGQAISDALSHYLKNSRLNICARIASELSGFGLKDDLSDTLVLPVTQSGTTTDTNRAVAMARERGAQIISIVNRRQSDITAKSHGVFYTSDGRDIEMSVASTKAFYAQIVAGHVLALYFTKVLKARTDEDIASALEHLESAPRLMERIFDSRDVIAASVKKTAGRRFWAIVGSGPNKAAADEIRIKLSELCYKTISADIVENKKHIDLSAEPLILVCASGNPPAVLEDVAKDVAIFRAHKAVTVVFADEGDDRFDAVADVVIAIPVAPAPLPVILNTMAGHLWGYFAARAIDEEAQIFREFRSCLATELSGRTKKKLSIFDIFDMIADVSFCRIINDFYALFKSHYHDGAFGVLNGKTIADLLLLLKYASGKLPLQDIRQEFKGEEDLVNPFDLLDATLGAAIDELTRPIDAIRHQAKTVTVGTSRKEKELKGVVFDLLEALKFSAKNLTYRNILSIHRLQSAVAAVRGYTLYDIGGLDEQGHPAEGSSIAIRAKGGLAADMKSRADHAASLMGVKKTIVSTGHVYLGRGKTDGAPIMIIPLQAADAKISHLLLIHITFNEALTLPEKTEVLGYRYDDIRNLINEYNLPWNDRYLETLSLASLFSEPIEVIAGQIKSQHSHS